MKKILLTTICLAFATFSFSQVISRDVVSSGGNYSSNSGYTLSSTIGETMITTLATGSNVLTQGFQQSFSVNVINGCTDLLACNYDATATSDDGSCFYQSNPVIDMSLYNWTFNAQWGCSGTIYSAQMEFDSSGTGVVNPGTFGATNVNWSLCDSILSWVYSGGTLYTSTNYNNGIFTGTMISGSTTGCFTLIPIIPGCMDSTSLLYNPQANVSDGSCCEHYLRLNMYSSWSGGWSGGIYWTMMDDNGDTVISTALTYNSSTDSYHNVDYICIPDGCYSIVCTNGGGSAGISWTLKDDSTNATILSGGCPFGPYFVGIGTSCPVMGCTDSLADNYDPTATLDDGSCIYSGCTDPTALNYNPNANLDDGSCLYCSCGGITGINVSDIIHDRATFNWNNMNSFCCQVDQIKARYRKVGTSSWSTKTMGSPTGSGCNTSNISKLILGLSPSTTYEYDFKIWYCNASTVNWHANGTFTTLGDCPIVDVFSATPLNPTKVQFNWSLNGVYEFVRIKLREDYSGATWFNAGGFGVNYPAITKTKNGLTPGATYRGQARTWCNPTGGAYRSANWTPLIWWTQPTSVRLEGENTAITNLEVYPNPSRDIFNITFLSEKKQDIEIRIFNVIGENIFIESKQQFIGQYTKQIMLGKYPKAIYFLEIETDDGVINKKLILQ